MHILRLSDELLVFQRRGVAIATPPHPLAISEDDSAHAISEDDGARARSES